MPAVHICMHVYMCEKKLYMLASISIHFRSVCQSSYHGQNNNEKNGHNRVHKHTILGATHPHPDLHFHTQANDMLWRSHLSQDTAPFSVSMQRSAGDQWITVRVSVTDRIANRGVLLLVISRFRVCQVERERAGDGRKASSVCRIWIHFEVDRTFPDLSKKRISDLLS